MNAFAIVQFLFFGFPLILGPGIAAEEVHYETIEFGSAVAVISIQESAKAIAAIDSQDGTVFKLHRPSGVFVDAGQASSDQSQVDGQDTGLIRSISQVRSANGIDLVLSFKHPAYVEPFLTADGLRFVFVARQDTEAKRPGVSDDSGTPESEKKIMELRSLVRDLSLEVLTLKKQLAKQQ